jgi:phospholipid-binding lipoprotein MlaA
MRVLKLIVPFLIVLGTNSYANVNITDLNHTVSAMAILDDKSKKIENSVSKISSKQKSIEVTDANSSGSNISSSIDEFEDEFEDANSSTALRFDPLEPYNRAMTKINDKMIIHILDPMVEGYNNVVPEGGRIAINMFFKNIQAPVRVANNLLQFKLKNATEETGRFVVNTIFGLCGFFDPAESDLKWEAHDEDFGQTLGYYGVSDAIPIVLPFLGPSNLRDLTGIVVDGYFDPLRSSKIGNANYKIAKNTLESTLYKGADMFNRASLHAGEYQIMKNDALDLYPFLQDSYSQHQKQKIKE